MAVIYSGQWSHYRTEKVKFTLARPSTQLTQARHSWRPQSLGIPTGLRRPKTKPIFDEVDVSRRSFDIQRPEVHSEEADCLEQLAHLCLFGRIILEMS